MKTSDLIALITQDSALHSTLNRAILQSMAAGTSIVVVVFFSAIGFRPDIDFAMSTGRFLFKFVFTIALTVCAGLLMFRIGKPGVPLRTWAWGLVVPFALLAVGAVVELWVMPSAMWIERMIGQNSRLCLTIIPALSLGPLACFLLVLRQGAPERPDLAGAVAGLTSAGIAATFYAANCTDDSPLFVLFWYTIAISMVVGVGALAGRKFLRW